MEIAFTLRWIDVFIALAAVCLSLKVLKWLLRRATFVRHEPEKPQNVEYIDVLLCVIRNYANTLSFSAEANAALNILYDEIADGGGYCNSSTFQRLWHMKVIQKHHEQTSKENTESEV